MIQPDATLVLAQTVTESEQPPKRSLQKSDNPTVFGRLLLRKSAESKFFECLNRNLLARFSGADACFDDKVTHKL